LTTAALLSSEGDEISVGLGFGAPVSFGVSVLVDLSALLPSLWAPSSAIRCFNLQCRVRLERWLLEVPLRSCEPDCGSLGAETRLRGYI